MEKYTQLLLKNDLKMIFPQQSFEYSFNFKPENDREYRLFYTGETDAFYYWKTEYMSTPIYRRTADALVRGKDSAFALRFKAADYPLAAVHKVDFPTVLGYLGYSNAAGTWDFGVKVSANGLKIKENGYMRVLLEVRRPRKGMMNTQANLAPDETYTIDIPEGSYELKTLNMRLENIKNDNTANINYIVEGENFEGEVIFESPFFSSVDDGWNIIPPFAPDSTMYQKYFNWLGLNLSRTEWPTMHIEINGKTVFDGEFFERCHRYTEKEIVLPSGILNNGENTVKFTLTSDWHDALPYRLHELGIVSEGAALFNIVSCPENVTVGKPFGLLLDIKNDVTISVDSKADVVGKTEFKPGLDVLQLVCSEPGTDIGIVLHGNGYSEKCSVSRAVIRDEDNVITGTGDMIYVNQDKTDSLNYFKWYMQNNIGDLLTIRPCYRWCGTRVVHYDTWEHINRLTRDLGMHISHMIDGREPQGMIANPPMRVMQGEQFLGRQLHERDGEYIYWGPYENTGDFWNLNKCYDTELIFDECIRQVRLHPDTAATEFHSNDIYNDGKRYWLAHDPSLPTDMKIIAQDVTNSLKIKRVETDSTRHTGPSILFKYFCLAGYDWIGAETMDSPTEFLMSAMRGAAKAFGIKSTGVHHALQWSTHPHDDEMHFRRYRLALYVSWMQGTNEINTEEGLWHMEEYYASHHRFSHAAKEHLKMQQDLNRYIRSHTRRGSFHAPIAVLHGQYDGFACFGGKTTPIWGQLKSRLNPMFDAEQSWQIPKDSFFPNMVRNWSACAHNPKTGPIGLVSGAPRGFFDIVPVERPISDDYGLMAYFSYNGADEQTVKNVADRVKSGATLLLTLAHLTDTTDRKSLESYELHYSENELLKQCLEDKRTPVFVTDTVNGKRIAIAANVANGNVLKTTDSGRPYITEISYGDGKIVLFNTKLYPGNPIITNDYRHMFEELSDICNAKEHVFPITGADVQGVVYDAENGDKDVYFIAVDWWNDTESIRKAELRVGEHTYDMSLPFGVMKKAVVSGDRVIYSEDEISDVLGFNGDTVTVQGRGSAVFTAAVNGKTEQIHVDFTESSVKEIKWNLK